MAKLKLVLTLPDGSSAGAEVTADWPSVDALLEYRGDATQLPKELTRPRARPNLLEYYWREYAARVGGHISVQQVGEWLPEDDVKAKGNVGGQ